MGELSILCEKCRWHSAGKRSVGGFHMMKLSGMDTLAIPEEEVVETAQELKGLGVEEIYTGHCTGNIAFGILKKELGEMVHALGTGETVVF